ncbi:sodium/hydrogen exchanger 9-like [Echeneis naucrates]|uniref:sodium/hydrogen exchanger 9-like n=1 Tax=Echeneis naucrates TaxID=173247 RepID=UPI001113376A|nr:sodium/hydrogen exchanger 9-like [Echeneis naucrates]
MSATVSLRPDNALLVVLAAASLGLLTVLTVWTLKQFRFRFINENGVAMFYGMLLGLVVRCLSFNGGMCMERLQSACSCGALNGTPHILMVNISSRGHCYQHFGELNQNSPPISTHHMEIFEVLLTVFLPPIIFYGAYVLNQKRLIENIGSVLTFAFLGTIISCAIIGACVYGFTRLMVLLGRATDGDFSVTDCLLFGAIMSATDPVSVLGLLSELRVDLGLYTLLFGESVLNDAVAIVLTHAISTFSQMWTGHTFNLPAFLYSVGYFLGVFIGSFLWGFIFTVITALLTKFTSMHESPLLETSVLFLLSWSSFLSAEASGLSGILAVLSCGLSQARYSIHNLSSEGKSRTKELFEVLNFLGEIFIFSYMGYVLLTFPHHVFKALFISGAFLSMFISRACNIYTLSFLLNLGRTNKIPSSFQHFMMFAGLRGAVALSLAVRDTSTEVKRTILTTTVLLACFTIWVLGTAANPMLRCLDIRMGVNADENPEEALSSEVAAGEADTTPGLWHRLDYKYVKPVLTHCGPLLTESLPQWCGSFARILDGPRVREAEEQLCQTEPDDSTFDLDKSENQLESIREDSGSEHQEDLVGGDLGLGTAPALSREP